MVEEMKDFCWKTVWVVAILTAGWMVVAYMVPQLMAFRSDMVRQDTPTNQAIERNIEH